MSSLLVTACLLCAPVQDPEAGGETRKIVEQREDGCTVEREVRVTEDGELVDHGAFRVLFPNGKEKEKGAHTDGARSGKWVVRHANGKRAAVGVYRSGIRTGSWRTYHDNGERESEGKYAQGFRDGSWRFWLRDGSPDEVDSGKYTGEQESYDSGANRWQGESVDGLKHGPWTYWWENGQTQLRGTYSRGQLEGDWIFRHADGTYDPSILSGRYADGHWVGALDARPEGDPVADLGPMPREANEKVLELVIEARAAEPPARAPLAQRVVALGRRAVPEVVDALIRCDLSDAAELEFATWIEGAVLSPIYAGVTYGIAPDDRDAANRLAVQRWRTLWELTRDDEPYWVFDVPHRRRSPATAPVFERPVHRAMLAPTTEWEGPVPRRYRNRFTSEGYAKSGPPREALDLALAWLASHQAADGSWSPDAFKERCGHSASRPESEKFPFCDGPGNPAFRTGTTGLALLALLGDGNTPESGQYREAVTKGLSWLLSQQQWSAKPPGSYGLLGKPQTLDFIYNHAVGTLALAEGLAFCRSRALEEGVTAAVGYIERARNPFGAWRYDVPPIGENDTSVTVWMVAALTAAETAGVPVALEALLGARDYIDEVTDPAIGRVGYDSIGSLSSRTANNEHFPRDKGEAMTSAGLLCRYLVAKIDDVGGAAIVAKHGELLRRKLPEWDPEGFGCDMYYWFYGTHAMFQLGKPYWGSWQSALDEAVVPNQRMEGHLRGSWDPVGPWGHAGGRIYSTALMAMALQGSFRYARFGEE